MEGFIVSGNSRCIQYKYSININRNSNGRNCNLFCISFSFSFYSRAFLILILFVSHSDLIPFGLFPSLNVKLSISQIDRKGLKSNKLPNGHVRQRFNFHFSIFSIVTTSWAFCVQINIKLLYWSIRCKSYKPFRVVGWLYIHTYTYRRIHH